MQNQKHFDLFVLRNLVPPWLQVDQFRTQEAPMKKPIYIAILLSVFAVGCLSSGKLGLQKSSTQSLKTHIRKQRKFLQKASVENKENYFRSIMPTHTEFEMLFGKNEDAWQSWNDEPRIDELVKFYGDGGKSAKIFVEPLEQTRLSSLVQNRQIYRIRIQKELNLKPGGQGDYAFVNDRWVLLRPPEKTLEMLERNKRTSKAKN